MKLWLIGLFLLSATALAESIPLIIQPYYVKDIYGSEITSHLPFKVSVLTLRNFEHDRYRDSRYYALQRVYKKADVLNRPVFIIGDKLPDVKGSYLSIFRDKTCQCYTLGKSTVYDDHKPLRKALSILESNKIYIISDGSELSKFREDTIENIMREVDANVEIKRVQSVVELRALVVSLNKENRSVLVINAYDIADDSGGRMHYRSIEHVVTNFNTVHLEIGVYRTNHLSALAIGLDPADISAVISSIIQGKVIPEAKVKSSVNVNRLSQLGLTNLATGSFKEAFLYEPLKNR